MLHKQSYIPIIRIFIKLSKVITSKLIIYNCKVKKQTKQKINKCKT